MSLTSLRLSARLARREVVHRPWRTLLVALLVAGPVAGMTVAVTLIRTDQLSPLEEWRLSYGTADALLGNAPGAGGPPEKVEGEAGSVPAPHLPLGGRVISYRSDWRLVNTAGGRRLSAEVSNLPLSDPLIAPTVSISGRAPANSSEVLLSPRAAATLGVGLGDTIDLQRPVDALVTVVGVGGRGFMDDLLVLHPDAPFPARPGGGGWVSHLVDLPDHLTPGQVQAWATASGAVLKPGLVQPGQLPGPAGSEPAPVRWSWFAGAVVLTVMGIVIASAFATGARRQLTTLGQLAANGAPPRTLRLVLVLQGTWTGLAGAAAGLVLGAGALAALVPHRDRLLGQRITSYDVQWVDLGPIVLLGVAASTIAAVIPARSASRIPVLVALAGRRPLAAVPPWLPVTGVVICGAGLGLLSLATVGATAGGPDSAVWALTGIVGGVALLLGVCFVAPAYVSVLGPAATRLQGSWRLAARSLARQRSRTGAVVSAICVSAALAVALSAIIQSVQANDASSEIPRNQVVVSTRAFGSDWRPGRGPGPEVVMPPPQAVVDRLREVLPGAQVLQQAWVALSEEPDQVALVADAAFLDTYPISRDVRLALERAGLAKLGPEEGQAPVMVRAPGRQPVPVVVPVLAGDLPSSGLTAPVLIAPSKTAELGLTPQPGDVVLRQDRALSSDQRAAVELVFEEQLDDRPRGPSTSGGPPPFTNINLYRTYGAPDPMVVDAVLGGLALLFTLFVVASSLALAAAETRAERDLLDVVGASPRAIRSTSGLKAVVVTALGTALALPVGLLPVLVFTSAGSAELPFVIPWRVIALLVVAVPLLAGLITTSTSALGLQLRPVRASTMAFD